MQCSTNIVLLPLAGELTAGNLDELRRELKGALDAGCHRIILQMAQVSYVDSAGMGLILATERTLRARGGLLSLACVRPEVYRALCIACLVDIIPTTLINAQRRPARLTPGTRPVLQQSFEVDPHDMCSARRRVKDLLGRVKISADDAFDLCLACGEAIGNAADHGNPEGISMSIAAYADRVVCEVLDRGVGFEIASDEEPESECACAEGERGRGIKLMRLLCDDVSITRRTDISGTCVELVKLL